jgi:predicted metalloendopeptidase
MNKAYQKWIQKNGQEPLLPGVPFNQNQLFFINFATNWCSKVNDEIAKFLIINDYHSPTQFRYLLFE